MDEDKFQKSPFKLHEIDELYNNVKKFRSTSFSRELLNFIAKFPFVSPYNAMLVFMQKPGSRYVATAKVWKESFKRTPKSDARPLVILQTFGPVSFVFEINDTEGEDVPEELLNPFKVNGSLQGKKIDNLMKSLLKEAIIYAEQNYGSDKAGHIQKLVEPKKITLGKNKNGEPINLISQFALIINKNFN